MPGAGSRPATTPADPPPARLLDLTRSVSRVGRTPTGVDRVERAYLTHLAREDVPLWSLIRTALGHLLLDPEATRAATARMIDGGWERPGIFDRLARRGDPARAGAEGTLRRLACARARPARLGAMLRRHLPPGTSCINVGHSALEPATLAGLAELPEARLAVMIHDTIPLDRPGDQRPGTAERFAAMLARTGRAADMLIANSRATADDIARHLPAPRPEILPAPLGIDPPCPGTAPRGPWTGQPYFVILGTIEPRKNHALLLDLWEDMGTAAPPLLICGRRGWENHATFARLDARPPRVHELNGLADAALFGLLADSAGLLFPSHAEGYGLPLAEAAALGVPVLCNDLPVFREIGGAFPIYAATSDRYRWRNTIETLERQAAALDDGQRRQRPGIAPPCWQDHFNTVLKRI